MTMGDDYWWADALRFVVGVSALLLAVLVARFGWRHHGDPGHPHIGFYLSYALAMILLAFMRLSHIGRTPTWDLWIGLTVTVLGVYAAVRTWRLRFKPPHRR